MNKTLEIITGINDDTEYYRVDYTEVSSEEVNTFEIHTLPSIIVLPVGESESKELSLNTMHDSSKMSVTCVYHGEDNPVKYGGRILHDIKKALLARDTLDNLATDLTFIGETYEAVDNDDYIYTVVAYFKVDYRYSKLDPTMILGC